MPRLTREDALAIANNYRIPLSEDYHKLSSEQVADVVAAADANKYRNSKNASGSRGRCFHAYLRRAARK